MNHSEQLKADILSKVAEYYRLVHAPVQNALFVPEKSRVNYAGRVDGQLTVTFGDIGTSSFYSPRHMTMGEGGAVYTSDPLLRKIMLSMRDWGASGGKQHPNP